MLSDIINKSNPVYKQKEMPKSEYKKLVDRNTELIDKMKYQEQEIERLNNIINELEEYMEGKDIYKILLYKLRDLKDSDKE